ncbi:FAD-dependent urate hydroxylase [Pigmentiphaga humi]|uniref:FAD-dependent urate hydroxylase n=1 Tax=Pigmentiphaga humi TaxID=2478468 RepID=A0A3P4AXC7_9BURK|nr:FAD-dependent oxidoreductase [Pigmentiphaga humi]VCU68719.1 FAD-dependent urate hydroxylase [Pigmentiphaga humi]
MSRIKHALVVGGGIGGMSAAICLRRRGIDVRLVDLDPDWRVYGAGITITGPTLRAFRELGILDEIAAQAYTGHGIQICDMLGTPLKVVPTPVVGDGDLPGSGGVMRPALHAVLSRRTLESGARVSLGVTVDGLEQDGGGVAVRFSDGTSGRYDLVIGADGIFSRIRTLIFPGAPRPVFTGQCAWRLVVPRAPGIDRRHFFLGGPVKLGLNPVSDSEMYMFLLEPLAEPNRIEECDLHRGLAALMQGYGGVLEEIRGQLDEVSRIVRRPLEGFLLPAPWHAGRVVLIGDAAHPTTPQLASGAGMAVEDALVLAEELDQAESVAQALHRFMQRRYERCRLVVENSLRIGCLEQAKAPIEQQAALVETSLAALAQPI